MNSTLARRICHADLHMNLPYEQLILGLGAFLLVFLVTTAYVGAVPTGALVGVYALVADQPVSHAALLGAGAITAGRVLLAITARKRAIARGAGGQYRTAMQQSLASSGQFRKASFALGAFPVVPARLIFPLLGAIGAPLQWLAAGTLIGQFIIVSITTWISVGIARTFTSNDADAATFLGVVCALLVALAWSRRNAERDLRMPNGQSANSQETVISMLGLQQLEIEGIAIPDDEEAGEVLEGEVIEPQSDESSSGPAAGS